jgi:hypothetical protein
MHSNIAVCDTSPIPEALFQIERCCHVAGVAEVYEE